MPIATFLRYNRLAASVEPGVEAAQEADSTPTSAELLTPFLSSDTLLWGCVALAVIALFTVSRVVSKRRDARKVNRTVRAQSQALHDFLDAVRAEHVTVEQGIWHYDFTNGAQQYSDDFKRLVGGAKDTLLQILEVEALLEKSGVDLVTLACDHFEHVEPYVVQFSLQDEGSKARLMVLKACNLRNGEGQVQRMVAVISEAPNGALHSHPY